jgi:hypothetical protein
MLKRGRFNCFLTYTQTHEILDFSAVYCWYLFGTNTSLVEVEKIIADRCEGLLIN